MTDLSKSPCHKLAGVTLSLWVRVTPNSPKRLARIFNVKAESVEGDDFVLLGGHRLLMVPGKAGLMRIDVPEMQHSIGGKVYHIKPHKACVMQRAYAKEQ